MTTVDDRIEINLSGNRRDFRFPHKGNTRLHVMNIMTGKDYPLFQPNRFRPSQIVDIGANLGATAIFMRHAYPGVPIVCCEPALENVEYLKRNLEGLSDITVHACGLGREAGVAKLYHGLSQTLQHSIVPNAEVNSANFETIRIESASEFLKPILRSGTLIKIDTEGCELPILEGIHDRFSDLAIIYLEYHSESDRRYIDRMLEETHIQYHCDAKIFHRGNLVYVIKSLADQDPDSVRLQIG